MFDSASLSVSMVCFNLTAYFSVVTLWYLNQDLFCNEIRFSQSLITHVCLCMCTCAMHVHMYVHACMCMYIYNYVCIYVCVRACLYLCGCVSVCVCVVCAYMCVGDDQGFCKSSWLPILRFWR